MDKVFLLPYYISAEKTKMVHIKKILRHEAATKSGMWETIRVRRVDGMEPDRGQNQCRIDDQITSLKSVQHCVFNTHLHLSAP